MLLAGGQAHSHVRVHVRGVNGDPADVYPGATVDAAVYRGQQPTIVPVTIANPESGSYAAEFTVPAGWSAGELVFVEWTIVNGRERTSCMKPVGIVGVAGGFDSINEMTLDRIADLLEADQSIENGFVVFRLAGTSTVLMRKTISGTTCADNVSLVDNPP